MSTSQGKESAGPRVLVIEHESHAGLGRMAGLSGCRIDQRRPDLGDPLPADLAEHDALVVLGGSMAAWEDDAAPWLVATRALIADAVEQEVPALGICLGSQLMALATGGTVRRGEAGLEVGLAPLRLTEAAADDPFFGAVRAQVGDAFGAVQWHQDAITALPPGAVLMATGEQYPNQGYRLGECAWGVQYHPEVDTVDWADWMSVYTPQLDPGSRSAQSVDDPVREAEGHLQALAQAHSQAFREVLRSRLGR